MIELVVLNYLKSVLDIPILMEKSDTEKEYILVEKTGGGSEDFIQSAIFIVQSYSTSLYKAAELNERVKLAMIGNGIDQFGITADTEVSRCELNSDYNYTDTTNKTYRYQAVFDLVF